MRRLLLAVLVSTGIACAPADAMDPMGDTAPHVAIVYQAFDPSPVTALTGDTVMWQNESPRPHTVTADDGSFGSGQLFSTFKFEHQFTAAGTYSYYCTIHAGMRGEVDVYDLLLDAPKGALAPGQALTLQGRSALAPGTPVSIEADEGGGFRPVATATAMDGGRFQALLHPAASASYRAVSGSASSPTVPLRVVNRKVRATAARHAAVAVISVHVSPAAPGATVVLQVASRERFGWWPTRRARLDGSSRARFTLKTRKRLRTRVVLTLRDGATALATSRTVRVAAAHR